VVSGSSRLTRSFLYSYSSGQLVPADGPALLATDRGFTLGDGVFETLRTAGGRPFLLPEHLARLRHGAAVLDLPLLCSDEDLAGAVTGALSAAGAPGEAIVRLSISRGPATGRGLLPAGAGPPTVALQVSPLPAFAQESESTGAGGAPGERGPAAGSIAGRAPGLHMLVATVRRNEGSPLSRIKALSYLDNVLARLEAARAGADEALMLNNRGVVACASAGNIFWIDRGGRLITPPLSCGVLAGITRHLVLLLAEREGLPCRERAISLAEMLAEAQEAFVTNSVVGVQAVTSVAGIQLPLSSAGPLTQRLAALYAAAVDRAATGR
jgi:branched-subunit amino acid aminotransferase/4-amino-4-deoxychorismate lyase